MCVHRLVSRSQWLRSDSLHSSTDWRTWHRPPLWPALVWSGQRHAGLGREWSRSLLHFWLGYCYQISQQTWSWFDLPGAPGQPNNSCHCFSNTSQILFCLASSLYLTVVFSLFLPPQVVEDGYEFFARRQLVTLFSAPNYCGDYDNAGGMMTVDEGLMCSFQVC